VSNSNKEHVFVDVREKDEFQAEHIQDSIHIPLSQFGLSAPGILKQLAGKKVVLVCQSGKRAEMARRQLGAAVEGLKCEILSGGILEWKRQGKPTVAAKKSHLPIMRQVQLVAGLLVLVSSLLALLWDQRILGLTVFIGFGLTLAGLTGFCGMAELLSRMPWNKGVAMTGCDQEISK
jgi:rhodanese-related sulfurtransferase